MTKLEKSPLENLFQIPKGLGNLRVKDKHNHRDESFIETGFKISFMYREKFALCTKNYYFLEKSHRSQIECSKFQFFSKA